MRRFRFRLAPLLRVRAQLERVSRRELATALAAVDAVDQRLAAATAGLRDCAAQGARPDAVGALARSLETGLRRHQWRLQKEREGVQRKADVARADYTQKARDLKTLQRLREQQRAAWQQQAQRSEQAELDELASLARAAVKASAGERT